MSQDIYYSTADGRPLLPPVTISVRNRQKYWLHLLLFFVTLVSTLFWGAYWMILYESGVAAVDPVQFFLAVLSAPGLLVKGIAYSFTIMAILFCHEMGHYLACRYYGINATLPFFLPAPVGTGTFGAFIRIRSPFPNRRSLFDVGLAGPIAGFVVALPFIYLGLRLSTQVISSSTGAVSLGEPLIFKLLSPAANTENVLLHPIGFAAWFGCLATALNLLPIAQLDGGHVSYALFRRRAHSITWIVFLGLLALAAYGFTRSFTAGIQWIFYSLLLLLLKKIAGFRHPPTIDDDAPIGWSRVAWGVIAAIVFILTFVPVTIFS